MPDLTGLDLLGEWRKLMEGLMSSASAVGRQAELPRQLLEPMQRQMQLVQEVIERERELQRQIAGRVLAPVDAVFDVLAESAVMLRRQAEALEAAGRALEDSASLVKTQADLFDRTIGILREPTELAKSAVGLERNPRRGSGRRRTPVEGELETGE